MSNTVRSHSKKSLFSLDDFKVIDGVVYQIWNGELVKCFWKPNPDNVVAFVNRHNAKLKTGSLFAYGPSASFRRAHNRSDRRAQNQALHVSLTQCEEEEFVACRAPMPYWD